MSEASWCILFYAVAGLSFDAILLYHASIRYGRWEPWPIVVFWLFVFCLTWPLALLLALTPKKQGW